jgi:hypothetical protein
LHFCAKDREGIPAAKRRCSSNDAHPFTQPIATVGSRGRPETERCRCVGRGHTLDITLELFPVALLELRIEVAAGRIEGSPCRRAPGVLNRGRRGRKGRGRKREGDWPVAVGQSTNRRFRLVLRAGADRGRGSRGGPSAVIGEQGKAAAAPRGGHLLAVEREQRRKPPSRRRPSHPASLLAPSPCRPPRSPVRALVLHRRGAAAESREEGVMGANRGGGGEEVAEVGRMLPCLSGRAGGRRRRRRGRGGDGELQHCSTSYPTSPSPSATRRWCSLFLARGFAPAARADGSTAPSPVPVPQPRHDCELTARRGERRPGAQAETACAEGERERAVALQRRERIPGLRDGRAASAFCSSRCTDCWSVNSGSSFLILRMQHAMHKLLETVLCSRKAVESSFNMLSILQ